MGWIISVYYGNLLDVPYWVKNILLLPFFFF